MSKVKRTGKSLQECPNCGSIWGVGSEEWDWQQCDCCGWPDNDDEDYDEDDWDDDDERNEGICEQRCLLFF